MRRFLVLWIPLLLLVATPLWLPAAARFLQPRSGSEGRAEQYPPPQRSYAMQDVVFTQSKNGRAEWQIEADRLLSIGSESNLRLEEVEALLFDRESEKFQITSRTAFYDSERKLLTLQEEVVVLMDNDYELLTPVLHYDDAARKIRTKAPVRITGQDLRITGQGLSYDLDTGSYLLNGRVDFVMQ